MYAHKLALTFLVPNCKNIASENVKFDSANVLVYDTFDTFEAVAKFDEYLK